MMIAISDEEQKEEKHVLQLKKTDRKPTNDDQDSLRVFVRTIPGPR
jgi:hypothetical protein